MIMNVLLFAVGFVCLIFGGDWFVDGASSFAKSRHMSPLLIGATIVSIGTTLPEVMVSSQAALKGSAGISYGNAIGSIICNTALISAITITANPSAISRKTLIMPVSFFFVSAAIYCFTAYTTGFFSRILGLIFLVIFACYMYTLITRGNSNDGDLGDEIKDMPLWKQWMYMVAGAGFIAIGANLLVDNGTAIASAVGIPDSVIGLTIVALGTSLPELITAINSLRKGVSSMSLGNVIGANLFNLILVSGMAMTISPFHIPTEKVLFGTNASLVLDIPVMLTVMLIMTVPTLLKERVERWQGILLLIIYFSFLAFQFLF